MSIYQKQIKRCLRFHRDGDTRHALLELKAVDSNEKDWWFLLVSARVHASLKELPLAIADYMNVMSAPNTLNARNRTKILRAIVVYSTQLNSEQKTELAGIFRKDFGFSGSEWYSDSWMETWRWLQFPEEAAVAIKTHGPGTGKIKNIGKFLLDACDVEKLNRLVSEEAPKSKIRILKTWGPK
jgi:hypothetical protein